jgi:hypothetical protein
LEPTVRAFEGIAGIERIVMAAPRDARRIAPAQVSISAGKLLRA